MTPIDRELARVIGTYESAVFKKDVDTLMRLYDPDVRVFDAWGVWSYQGADAWQRAVEAWFTSLGTERVKVSFDQVSAWPGKDQSCINAIVTYANLSPDGVQQRTMQNRITWVLRTVGHVPRIVHEHTSAPIGFEGMKAILTQKMDPSANRS